MNQAGSNFYMCYDNFVFIFFVLQIKLKINLIIIGNLQLEFFLVNKQNQDSTTLSLYGTLFMQQWNDPWNSQIVNQINFCVHPGIPQDGDIWQNLL